MTDLLLGIDVGTTACKAAVVDSAGAERAHGSAPTPWERVPTGAEIDPGALLRAAIAAARAALREAPEGRVRGIGVAGMAETGVLLDGRGEPLAPAIAWHDARGEDEARLLGEDLGEERFVRTTGLFVSALCTAPKLRWMVAHRPAVRAARRWLNVGEWVVRGLGGDEVTELSLASRTGLFDLEAKAPFADALAWTGLADDLLPEAVLAGTAVGVVGDALPEARGAVLTVAGHDHLAAGVGVGVVAPGDVLDSCGTAEALVRVVAPPLDGDRIVRAVEAGVSVGWHVADGRHAILGGVWTGLALREVLDGLGVGDADRHELDAGALATAPGDAPALELDLYSLERRPPILPGGVAPERVWRAALDVAAAEIEAQLGRIDAIAGRRRKVVVTGGWARDEALLAAKAAHIGPFERPPVVEAGARGAALLAGVAAGLFESADALPPVPVPAGRS
ncbi:MAG TPA: FGGY family carbohydrate kinase [Solirubrobacteraceae bacterium]|nr:FGGY family carbohydrate kinase [Solirubrobacteraceae bacterium]